MTTENSIKKRTPASLAHSFFTVSSISFLSMVISFFMNIAIAAIIGASASKDAYDVASYLPRVMLYLFGLDVFRGISTSLFSRLDINKTEDPSKVFSSLLNGLIIICIFAIIIAELFVKPLVYIIGPGLDAQSSLLAINLARYLVPTLALLTVTSLARGILLAHHYYGLAEALASFPKLTTLVGVLIWGKHLDVWILVIALIIGLAAQLPVMLYFLSRCGLKYSPIIKLSPATKSAIIDAVPIIIGSTAVFLSGIFLQRAVSYGDKGTLACFNYSLILCGALTALVCRPASSALAPRISRTLEIKNYKSSSSMFGKSLGLIMLISLTGIAVVWTQASIIVDVILGRGKFTPEAVELTSRFLKIVFIGVLGTGFKMLALTVLLATRKAKTIMIYSLITGIIQATMVVKGRHYWGVYAAPIAYLAGVSINALLHTISAVWLVKLHKKFTSITGLIRWIIASLIVLIIPMVPSLLKSVTYKDPMPEKITHLAITASVTAISFFAAAWIVKLYTVKNITDIATKIVDKFRKN